MGTEARGRCWYCNPAVDRQPDLRRPGLAEQHSWIWTNGFCLDAEPPCLTLGSSTLVLTPMLHPFPSQFASNRFFRRSSGFLVPEFEFFDLDSSCLTRSWAPAHGLEPICALDPWHPSQDGGGTDSLAAGEVGAAGPLRPIWTHQTKLQDLPEVPKLIRTDSRARKEF